MICGGEKGRGAKIFSSSRDGRRLKGGERERKRRGKRERRRERKWRRIEIRRSKKVLVESKELRRARNHILTMTPIQQERGEYYIGKISLQTGPGKFGSKKK